MYNKLFSKILDSSVWLEDHATVRVWFTLMAAMDQDGFAPFASAANLASRARVTLEESRKALQRFMAPDQDSSDPENDGRRVERVPGGFIVLNALKYKELSTRDKQREQTKERVKRFRDKQKPANQQALHMPESNAPVTTSQTETETQEETKTKNKDFVLPEWMDHEAWNAFEEMRKKQKKPMTNWAKTLIVKKLVGFEAAGHNHVDVLNQSILSGWQDVYEPKSNGGNRNGNHIAGRSERTAAALQQVLGETDA